MTFHPGLTLRAEHSADLEPLAALLVAVDADWGEVPFRVAVRDGGLAAARDVIMRPKLDSVVAELDGKVVGYGALRRELEAVMLVNMLVSPDHQGKGIGRLIVTELCSRVSYRGEHIHLDVLLDSRAAHHLYQSLGFVAFEVSISKISAREGRLMCLAPDGSTSCASGVLNGN
jgi:ribosomal protein S18 acetylase RimI-like enzyme